MAKKEQNTNATLPDVEYLRVDSLANTAGWSVAAFSRMLLLWALPRWSEAWDELTEKLKSGDADRFGGGPDSN